MKHQIQKFLREEDGITALEYGILAALIVAAIVIFAGNISGLFHRIWEKINGAVPA